MVKLLGRTVRRHRSHPQHQVTFATRTLIPRTIEKRRAGRHRLSWTHQTVKTAWSISLVADSKSSSIQCAMLCIVIHDISSISPHNPSFDVENREMRLALQLCCRRGYRFQWRGRKKIGLVLSDWVFARSVLSRGPCLFLRGN